MQSKEIINGGTTSVWAVVHPHYRSSKSNTSASTADQSSTSKVWLVNTDRYELTNTIAVLDTVFRTASADNRNYGYLVTNGTQFFVVKPARFIALYTALELRWAEEREWIAKREAQGVARAQLRAGKYEVARENLTNLERSIEASVRRLCGTKALENYYSLYTTLRDDYITNPDGSEDYRAVPSGYVRLDLEAFSTLLELALSAEDE